MVDEIAGMGCVYYGKRQATHILNLRRREDFADTQLLQSLCLIIPEIKCLPSCQDHIWPLLYYHPMERSTGLGVVAILLFEFLFSDIGERIENAQSVKWMLKNSARSRIAARVGHFSTTVFNRLIVILRFRELFQCYHNPSLDSRLR